MRSYLQETGIKVFYNENRLLEHVEDDRQLEETDQEYLEGETQ